LQKALFLANISVVFSLCSGVLLLSGGMKRHFILIGLLGLMIATPGTVSAAGLVRFTLGGDVGAGAYMGARLELAQDRRRPADEERSRNRGLDQAIKMVLRRTGGQFVSAEVIGEDTYRVVVRVGNRIVAYRVSGGGMEEE
jgi:hypothetical protein